MSPAPTPPATNPRKRVVVTGIGVVSPLAANAELTWERLLDGQSGIGRITHFDASNLPAQVAGQVPEGPTEEGGLTLTDWLPAKDIRKMDRFIHLGLVAAIQAVEDSGWKPEGEEDRCRTGVMIGSGIGGLQSIYEASLMVAAGKARRLSPFFIPSALINLASGHLSIKYGFKGPNHAAVTACATGVHAIGDASRLIQHGDADVMVAGGAEAAICELGIAGFCSARALSTSHNETPEKASRPWDKARDGFVMGEGAGVVVLEEYEHAKARGAHIYGEVAGYGLSGDAYHITAPAPNHEGAFRAMTSALNDAGVKPGEIDYVNAHGTSTMADELELGAMERLLGEEGGHVAMSSTKSAIGHLLGAAGAVEAIFCLLSMRDGVVPPTLNLDDPERDSIIDRVPHKAQKRAVDVALSNSFGFGGTNASLVLKKVPETTKARVKAS
ncbi:beta-ketoacyl-ACP synthase II [Formicincola oecophyllae]|uniref:3-oxoacyl-[acyl-carrier-protein] synthase 2 n=1 Tax=Formicincola oecophyllae TaxID=2558361 RepID=A0A4Y6U6A7_9PROT|nr:beta-ketoacyl-ACP synthase II [Formicincola oecophyllae]QDH12883.1 beta-ketoacyl-ACP synthase II [Formicincola oecophyllae]